MKHIHWIMALGLGSMAYAQTTGNPALSQETITVFTGFEPRLAEISKVQESPVILDTFPVVRDTQYVLLVRPQTTVYKPDTIQALRLKSEPLKKLHRLMVRGGFGNYTSFLGEVGLYSLRAKNNGYYVQFKHFSSSGTISERGNPQLSDNLASAGYQHRFKNLKLSIDGEYQRHGVHYYGFNPASDTLIVPDSTRQRYSMGRGSFSMESTHRTDSIRLNYKVRAQFYHMSDLYRTYENGFSLRANVNKFTDLFAHEFLGGNLSFDYYNLNRSLPSDTLGNGWIADLNPYFTMGGKPWRLQIGAGFTFAGADSGFFNVYPRIQGHYQIFRKYIILHGQLSGNYQRNTFNDLRFMNPFIMSDVRLKNANTPLDAHAGVKGAFSDLVSYDVGVGYRTTNNAAFFLDDTLNFHRRGFQVAYDRLNTFRIYANLEFQYGEKIQVGLRGNYYAYQTDQQAEAWYRPQMDITLSGRYNLGQKIIATAELYFLGQQQAPVWSTDANGQRTITALTIDPLFDINLSGTYRLNRNFSFFLRMNNMAAFRYNRFNRYPGFGFMIMGGFTITL